MKINFTPNIKILILAALLMPVLLSMGAWQLQRADEKKTLLSGQQQLLTMPAVTLDALSESDVVRYKQIKMTGNFQNEHSFLFDNRVRNGKVGYEVLTPFLDESSNNLVLVNRGWMEASVYRSQLPVIPPVNGERLVLGTIYMPFMKQGEQGISDGWPKVIQSVDVDLLAGELGQNLVDFTVRIDSASPGAFKTNWLVVNIQPEKHIAYAVQWFAMSLALFILAVYASVSVRKEKV